MTPSFPFRATAGRAVCFAILVCMAFHALYFPHLSEPIERHMSEDLAMPIELVTAMVLVLVILYPSPLLAGDKREIRMATLVIIAIVIVFVAMFGFLILWTILCLTSGISPRGE